MTRGPWLTEEEQHTWRLFLSANRLLMDHLGRQLQHDARMPHPYYEILVRLSEVPDRRLRMSQLASSSMSSRSRLSHAVAKMEQSGWVLRRGCETDRRGAVCELTEAGYAALRAAAPAHVAAVRESVFDQLSPEQVAQLGRISEAIVGHLTERHPDSDGYRSGRDRPY